MNDDNNLTNENQPSGEEPTKDKIPLWLQGLDDDVKGESTDLPEELSNTEDSWLKELDQKGEEIVDNGDAQAKTNKEVQLPDWIRENAELETEEPLAHDLSKDSDEKTADEAVLFKVSSTEYETDKEIPPNEPADRGFIEISELDMDDTREPVQFIPIEEEDVNEELPAWLHDMINDQPDQPVIQDEKEQMEQQIIENEQIISDQKHTDLDPKEETWQEIPTADDQGFHEPEQSLKGEEFSELPTEEITKPVQIEPGTSDEWVRVEEAFVLQEDQDAIERVEALLNEGNVISAIEMLTQELEGSPSEDGLIKLQTLINKFTGRSEKKYSALLELKGDVALKMNDLSGAFQAYAQALETLLSKKEVEDGTG